MKRIMTLAAAGLLVTHAAAAQTADEISGYVALSYTPVAGMAPNAPFVDTSRVRGISRTTITGRLGHMTRRGGLSLTMVGVGIELPTASGWRVGGTFGYLSASCGEAWAGDTDCSGDVMLGAHARRTLHTRPMSSGARGSRGRSSSSDGTLVVGVEGSAGYSPRQGEQAMAVAVGLPTAVVLYGGDVRIMPFLTPGLGYGRLGSAQYFDDERPTSHGTQLFLIGGGVGVQFGRSGLGATLGFQRVLKSDGGGTQIGVNMTWQGLTTRR